MEKQTTSLARTVIITNELALHARAAAKIVEIARSAEAGVWLVRDEEAVDAQSVIDILTLACGRGSDITVRIDQMSDMGILDKIIELVENGFGE